MGVVRHTARRVYRALLKAHQVYQRKTFQKRYGDGIDVLGEDWDNLIILDACRYDIFKQYNTLEGDLKPVISQGSHSLGFCNNNFKGRKAHDTIYVTTNPFGAVIGNNVFFKTITSFEGEVTIHPDEPKIDTTVTEDGDELRRTHIRNVDPERLKQFVIREYQNHPDKRIIAHFMQPHMPYIGSEAEELRNSLREEYGITFDTWNTNSDSATESISSLKSAARKGYITDDDLRNVYIENLQTVIEHVDDLIAVLDGKTVVTADHGELLGEGNRAQKYGHEPNLFVKELREVPWLTIESGQRRDINTEAPINKTKIEERDVDNQLELLGYK